jgi:CO/xanthine dehydrogenase Mo-binding subunit
LTGRASYVQDMRLTGMVFARVVRVPRHGAKLTAPMIPLRARSQVSLQ